MVGNLYAIHHDEKTWGDPYAWRPERFLSPDGKTLIKHEAFVPFSIGKRICPGYLVIKGQSSIVLSFSINSSTFQLN